MTTTLIKKIITTRCANDAILESNHINLYGFKLTSGKELIIPRINDDIVTSKPDDGKWKLNETDNTIEILTPLYMPYGAQIEVVRIIDVSDIEEVMIFEEGLKISEDLEEETSDEPDVDNMNLTFHYRGYNESQFTPASPYREDNVETISVDIKSRGYSVRAINAALANKFWAPIVDKLEYEDSNGNPSKVEFKYWYKTNDPNKTPITKFIESGDYTAYYEDSTTPSFKLVYNNSVVNDTSSFITTSGVKMINRSKDSISFEVTAINGHTIAARSFQGVNDPNDNSDYCTSSADNKTLQFHIPNEKIASNTGSIVIFITVLS